VDPRDVSAAFGDRRETRVPLDLIRGAIAIAVLPEGSEQAWSDDIGRAREALEDPVVVELSADFLRAALLGVVQVVP